MLNLTKTVVRRYRAISPVIAVLLMIAIAVAASLVAYAWVLGYLGFTTTKVNQAIQIQGMTTSGTSRNLVVFVQNVGQGTVKFNPTATIYVNDELFSLEEGDIKPQALLPGQTSTIVTTRPVLSDENVDVKIVSSEGISAETRNYSPLSSSSVTRFYIFPVDDFKSGDLSRWTGTDGSIVVQSTVAHGDSYATETTLSNAGSVGIAYFNFASAQTTLFVRSYVNFSATPGDNEKLLVGAGICRKDAGLNLAVPYIVNDAGTLKWALSYAVNGNDHSWAFGSALVYNPNHWYCIEAEWVSAAAGGGEVHLFVDGVEVVSVTGLTNLYADQSVQIGGYTTGLISPDCHVYVDDVVIDSSYIGW